MKKIPKHTGFIIPDNYFECFKEQLDAQLELERQLPSNKNESYLVPDSYFENNEKNLFYKVQKHYTGSTKKVIKLSSVLYVSMAIAAAIILLLVLKPLVQQGWDIKNLDTVAIESYLEQNSLENIEFDIESLVSAENNDLLLDGINTNDNNILDYLQQETDIMDLNLD